MAKEKTPVDTSLLRDGWKVGNIKKKGNAYCIEVFNNTEYANHVEYGHRKRAGNGNVEGVKMLEISLSELDSALPDYLKNWLRDLMRTLDF